MNVLCRGLVLFVLVASASAQKWRVEEVPKCGIQFEAPSRLERLPMKIGEEAVYQRARLRPKDPSDFVRAQYYWYCDVYEFGKKAKKPEEIELPEGIPEEMREQFVKLMADNSGTSHKSFREWLAAKKNVEVVEDGKTVRGRNGKLDYDHWVYLVNSGFGPVGLVYCEAAVYDFEDRQVALVIEMPLETMKEGQPKRNKPKSKWSNIIKKVMRSGKAYEGGDDVVGGDKKRDKYADNPEKIEALGKAKANIAGLSGWDYFTQPNYIVLYSWNFERPDERNKAKKQAEYYSERLEKMRELYLGSYPLDATGTKAVMPDPKSIPSLTGPITGVAKKKETEPTTAAEAAGEGEEKNEVLGKQPYSVFRLCATYDQFQKYGESPPGVVGWYSPSTKELVVFLGGDQMMGDGATETVTYHEGWHQYADFYFHHPQTPKHGTLHRWFDEGHGDYFGGFRWGSSGWKYVGSKMRYDDCKQMVRKGDFVPFKDIVYWDRRRFYSKDAPYYYAQAFSMIDFMRRGEKSRGWDERWGGILDMYRKVMLVKGEDKLAVDTAFRDFTPEDWAALETAWKSWVSSNKFLNGR